MLVTDSFCSSNRGDAAILDGILGDLRTELPEAEITVVSHFPDIARHFHPGIQVLGDDDPILLAQALVRTDAVVSCGGSFLNDIYALNLNPRLALYHAAHRAEVPVAFYAQSMGPFTSRLSREGARTVLDGATWILARDAITAGIVRDLGVAAPVEVGVDAAVDGPWEAVERTSGDVPLLGVTVRGWYFPGQADPASCQSAYEDAVVETLTSWVERTGGQVKLFSNCTDFGGYRHDDRICARRIATRVNAASTGSPAVVDEVADRSFQDLRGQIATCDFFLATRMHSLIFATMAGVPSFGIAYERKTPGWLARLGLEVDALHVDIEDCSTLNARFWAAWERRDAQIRQLEQALPRVRQAAATQRGTLASIVRGFRPTAEQARSRDLPGWQGETFKYDVAHRRLRQVVDIVLAEGGQQVLDVGCSTGMLGRMLGPSFDYTGIDIAREAATERDGFRIRTADLNREPLPAGTYDTVLCCGSLEYLDDLPSVLSTLRERVQPGALGVFTLYNLAHFARVVRKSGRHPTWRFTARPDELLLMLDEAGWSPRRIEPTFVGYGPSRAVNAELPTEHDRQGGGQLAPLALVRRAQQIIVVCRAGTPNPGIGAVERLASEGSFMDAMRITLDLVKRFQWSGRLWNDLAVLTNAFGQPEQARARFRNAIACDPGHPEYRTNYAAVRGDLAELAATTDDLELAVLLNPANRSAWDTLVRRAVERGQLPAAAMLSAMRDAVPTSPTAGREVRS